VGSSATRQVTFVYRCTMTTQRGHQCKGPAPWSDPSTYRTMPDRPAVKTVRTARQKAALKVGRCRLPLSKPVLKARMVSALDAVIM